MPRVCGGHTGPNSRWVFVYSRCFISMLCVKPIVSYAWDGPCGCFVLSQEKHSNSSLAFSSQNPCTNLLPAIARSSSFGLILHVVKEHTCCSGNKTPSCLLSSWSHVMIYIYKNVNGLFYFYTHGVFCPAWLLKFDLKSHSNYGEVLARSYSMTNWEAMTTDSVEFELHQCRFIIL